MCKVPRFMQMKGEERRMKVASYDKREWIDPWRDRRPMTDDNVLVTRSYRGERYVVTSWYCTAANEFACNGTVLAWKPLEEPYDPTAEEEEKPFADAVTVTLYPMDKEAGYEN